MSGAPRVLGLGLLVALGMSAVPPEAAAPTARRGRAQPAADTVLVRIGKDAITPRAVQQRIEELPEHLRPQFGTPEGRQRLLDRMVEEQVWLQSSQRAGVGDRPEVRRQIEQQRRDLLIRTYVNEVMADNPAPADSQVRAHYDEHLDDYRTPATVTISHIQTRSEAQAKRVRNWARSGANWSKLASRYSTDSLTRERGGALGVVTREGVFGHLGRQPALAESAFALGAGNVGGGYRTDRGWHVVRVDALQPEGLRPFDQVRSAILRQLSGVRSQEHYLAKLAAAKAALGVRADSSAIRKFLSQKKNPKEMFQEAQAAGSAGARIEAYRRLLDEHPDSEVSPQALFMIGFIQSEELREYEAAETTFRDLLQRYAASELVPSARWMLEHMRSADAPDFTHLEGDSLEIREAVRGAAAGGRSTPGKESSGKP